MQNVFLNITGVFGVLLLALSFGRQVSWKLENAGVTILQYGLTLQCLLWFHMGLLAEVTLYG